MKIVIRNSLFSFITFFLGACCLAVALQYSADSSGFPRAVALFLIILASADLIRTARGRTVAVDAPEEVSSWDDRKYLTAALLVFLSAPAYVVLARLFDFEIATFVYLVVAMYALGLRRPILIVAVSIGALVIVKGLFFVLLDVTRSATLIIGT